MKGILTSTSRQQNLTGPDASLDVTYILATDPDEPLDAVLMLNSVSMRADANEEHGAVIKMQAIPEQESLAQVEAATGSQGDLPKSIAAVAAAVSSSSTKSTNGAASSFSRNLSSGSTPGSVQPIPHSVSEFTTMRFTLPTLVATLAWSSTACGDRLRRSDDRASEIQAENCMVQYINKVNVAAKAEGTLMELRFEEGDTVTKGDVMAVIDDTAAALALELKKAEEKEAMLNAANEVNLEDAKNSEELASAEAEAYKELRRQGAIPYWEMEKKRLEAEAGRIAYRTGR